MIGSKDGVTWMRGRGFATAAGDKDIQATAMFYPAYLLRQPARKNLAWQDLRMLAKELNRLQLYAKRNSKGDKS